MVNVGRVLIFGPAFFILCAVGCAQGTPKVVPDNPVVVEEVRLEGVDALPLEVREDLRDALPLRRHDAH